MTGDMRTIALIVDVDGVVSPVHPTGPTWGDEVTAGVAMGPVRVSPMLCQRLDALASSPGVTPRWLTSWDAEMREGLDPWPGRDWPSVPVVAPAPRRVWWKQAALEAWLDARPEMTALVWCDDDLSAPSRRAGLARRFERRNIESLFVAPQTAVGLTGADLSRIERWVAARR
jgi:hypothetical protein